MLKHALTAAFFIIPLVFSQLSNANDEIQGVVTCNPQQLQPVQNPRDPEIALPLQAGEFASREYDIPDSEVRVSLSLSYAAAEPQESAHGRLGRLTISKTLLRRSPRGSQLMGMISPSSLEVRENNRGLELASHPAAAGSTNARILVGSSNGPIPRFAIDCEVNSR